MILSLFYGNRCVRIEYAFRNHCTLHFTENLPPEKFEVCELDSTFLPKVHEMSIVVVL